ncbi:MAG: hypothetical protein SF069_14690 [Phycisphaerae bacterium]|nr:hypothetical protein [Phycisphaerae bacterium]
MAIGALFVGCVGLPLAIVAGVESARCSVVLIAMGLLASLISVWLLAATRRHENAGERRLRKSLRIVWLAALASLCLAALPEYRSIDRGMSLAALTLCSVSILLLLYRLQAIEFHGRIRTHDAALSSHGATMMNWWFCTIALLVAGAFTYLFQDTEFPWAPLCTALPMVSISALWLVGATLIRMQRIVAGAQRRIQRCHANYQEMIGAAPAVNR